MIGIANLSKGFGPQTLFEKVSLQLNAACRYGLVGANGSGKTTFLKILAGDEQSSGGEVAMPKHARVGVLRQDRFESDDQLILDVAMMGDEVVHRALREQDELATQDSPDPMRIGEVDDILNAHDGYSLEARAAQVLMGLGIAEEQLRQPLRTLSGGYKLRVLLAQVLVSRSDALLLDEPTNHLDILSIAWLERFLAGYKGCVVVISHDHRFLDNVAHSRCRLRHRYAIHRQLCGVFGAKSRDPRPQGNRDSQGRKSHRRKESLRRSLSSQSYQGAPSTKPSQADRADRDPASGAFVTPLPQVQVRHLAAERPRRARH